jgi:N-acetylglucosaminyldiphosphoundecaprenol N-acetyl-beta-D-mannosaminyltransferase
MSRDLSLFSCFGLRIEGYSFGLILERILEAFEQKEQMFVVTANAEILLETRKNQTYREIVRSADIRMVDSFSLACLGRLKGAQPTRLPGIDLAEQLLKEAEERDWRVAFLGGDPGNVEKALESVRLRYPRLAVFGERGGSVSCEGIDDAQGEDTAFRLTQFAPDLLFVGFGFPRQEAWIHRHLQEFPSVRVAIGVGGTIDYWSGIKKRAPRWMQRIGLEWAWRLGKEPWRIGRIFRAVVIFPILSHIDWFFEEDTPKSQSEV